MKFIQEVQYQATENIEFYVADTKTKSIKQFEYQGRIITEMMMTYRQYNHN